MSETGRAYWRSLEERAGTPEMEEWLDREFPEGATELDGASRRTMLKLMAASFGLAGLVACSRPEERVLPASKGVEGYVPGNPLYYATAMPLGGGATGLVVEAHDGRPTKLEGNPQHPASGGACSVFAQASVLGLYDPDRLREVTRGGAASSWEEFAAFAKQRFAGDGAGVRFLSQTVNSPSLEAVRAWALKAMPQARWVEYEPVSRDEELAGAEAAFGRRVETHYHFEEADVVLSLDADFLGLDAPSVTYTRDFARRRGAETMNRLYVAESQFSTTGAMADHRFRMRAGEVAAFAAGVARELGLEAAGEKSKRATAVAADLKKGRGRSVVVAGPRQPAMVHALAHWMNQALGNAGRTVTYTESRAVPQVAALKELAAEMAAGQVATLVILGGNPAYDAPVDVGFAAAMKKVAATVYLGLEENETAMLAGWRLPEAHYLEAWSDARALDGTVAVVQPLIRPLYGGKTAAEVVAAISGYKDQRAYDIVRGTWLEKWPAAEREDTWRRCLHDGVIPNTAFAPVAVEARRPAVTPTAANGAGYEVAFYPSWSVWDGRFANNGWLQEAPEPMNKLTWDNAALVSPGAARELGVESGDVVEIAAGGKTVRVPVWVEPGHADGAVSLTLGYGRRVCGRVGKDVGSDVYPLRTSTAMHFAGGASLRKTGEKMHLATTQHHFRMEGRPLVAEGVAEARKEAPGAGLFSIFPDFDYSKGNQWGMAIDLNKCVGCNACVVACQAENNIPIVGKDQVLRGREMHWIRMDRYYEGPEEDPQAVTQPVACQQCERAPCESVCPVAATNHSPEGLNDMVYNRCVGTRYCSNNCPYKVRRFNFLDYHKGISETEKMAFNPDVTVRMRGVMEKCTYCVQRIEEKKIQAKAEGHRPLRDGEIVPACQQTCPAEAIVFGNINDPSSRVSQLKKQQRNYAMLGELNVKPRTSYLAKLRNPNPELA